MVTESTRAEGPAGQRCGRRSVLNRFRRDSQGVTAIEFGIVAMPFLALLMAIFETTLIFFTQSAIESGVSEAGRMIRTGQVQSEGISEDDFKALVCGSLSGYLDCNDKLSVDVRSFSDFASVSVPAATDADGNMTEDFEFSPGGASEVVVVRAFYIWDMLTPDHFTGMSNMAGGGHLIAAAAAFRNEPF